MLAKALCILSTAENMTSYSTYIVLEQYIFNLRFYKIYYPYLCFGVSKL